MPDKYIIRTRDDIRVLKLGETVWLDGRIVKLADIPCFKCCFFKIRLNSGSCVMSFSCSELVGKDNLFKLAFVEIKGGV